MSATEREEYLIQGAGSDLYCPGGSLERTLNSAKDRAKMHPRIEVRVYKLVALIKSEVQEPVVTLKK